MKTETKKQNKCSDVPRVTAVLAASLSVSEKLAIQFFNSMFFKFTGGKMGRGLGQSLGCLSSDGELDSALAYPPLLALSGSWSSRRLLFFLCEIKKNVRLTSR